MAKIIGDKRIPIDQLKNWDKNPRGLKEKDFERLKNQIKRLGIYVPLVVNENNIVLSGNMRLRAFRELGIDPVWCMVVEAKDEPTMIEYALSANDRVGYYEDDKLAELVSQYKTEIDLGNYSVDLGKTTDLQTLLDQFSPEILNDISLPDGQPGFEQMTFTLSTRQADMVKNAIAKVKTSEVLGQSENKNSNGNAISKICEKYVNG